MAKKYCLTHIIMLFQRLAPLILLFNHKIFVFGRLA